MVQLPRDRTTGSASNPARGILSEAEVEALVTRTLARGGFASYKHNPDGSESPYEMNINYLEALADPAGVRRPARDEGQSGACDLLPQRSADPVSCQTREVDRDWKATSLLGSETGAGATTGSQELSPYETRWLRLTVR